MFGTPDNIPTGTIMAVNRSNTVFSKGYINDMSMEQFANKILRCAVDTVKESSLPQDTIMMAEKDTLIVMLPPEKFEGASWINWLTMVRQAGERFAPYRDCVAYIVFSGDGPECDDLDHKHIVIMLAKRGEVPIYGLSACIHGVDGKWTDSVDFSNIEIGNIKCNALDIATGDATFRELYKLVSLPPIAELN